MLSSRRHRTGLVASGLVVTLLALSGCQVRPLYANLSGEAQSIGISEPATRVEQAVRNALVFGFGQGAGEPANPRYNLKLTVVAATSGVLPAGTQNEFSAARVTVTGNYTLTEAASGEQIASGSRQATALLDYPSQGFSRRRAERDGEDRAARELAALIQADIAAGLARRGR